MKIETRFVSEDGRRFMDSESCEKHEAKLSEFREMIRSKIGEYENSELRLGGHAMLDSLPFEAPWMSAYGACSINVTDVRRVDGVVEFQLADQDCVPYENGNVWCEANEFYSDWAQ
jgi:hypothetical protein